MRRVAVIAALLALACTGVSSAQTVPGSIVGKWESTLKGFDHTVTPHLDYEEDVVLTISENGNIFIERTRRPLNSKGSVTWQAGGVYVIPTPGIIQLTFSNNLGEVPAIWRYVIQGNTLTITDAGGVSRKFNRVYTAI